jgi:adenylate cyclase
MASEIERKYLVDTDRLQLGDADGKTRMTQGYLLNEREKNVRVRIAGAKAWLTIKGKAEGMTRPEYEYAIPVGDAQGLLKLTDGRLIEKTRYYFTVGGKTWEVDVFEGGNRGLVVAEIELESEDEAFEKPAWAAEEVTHDPRYLNAQLLLHPYTEWN